MKIFELMPVNATCKSFYGKAKVILTEGKTQLMSYNTIVCEIDRSGKFTMLWDGKSNTTTRHINEFKKQFLTV